MSDELMRASTEFAAIVPEVWSNKFYPNLLEKLPMIECVSYDYEGDIRALGDTVHISSFPQFDQAQDLAEDGVADAEALTPTNSNLIINHMLVKDYIVTFVAGVQALEASQKLNELAMHAIMKKMQAILIVDTVASASAPDHQIPYDSSTTLALADILEAKELLDTQDVEDVGRKGCVGAAQLNDLFNITGFTSRDYNPSANAMSSGGITSPIMGFDLKWSTEFGNTSLWFHPLYMQGAVQRAPQASVYDLGVQGKRAMRVNFTALFGDVQVDNTRVVEIA